MDRLDEILDKVYSKVPPYMGQNGMVEDEEFNHYERHELRAALDRYIADRENQLLDKVLAMPSMQHVDRDKEAYRKGKQTDTKRGIRNTLRNEIRAELAALKASGETE